jgi:hypothetical protein
MESVMEKTTGWGLSPPPQFIPVRRRPGMFWWGQRQRGVLVDPTRLGFPQRFGCRLELICDLYKIVQFQICRAQP